MMSAIITDCNEYSNMTIVMVMASRDSLNVIVQTATHATNLFQAVIKGSLVIGQLNWRNINAPQMGIADYLN